MKRIVFVVAIAACSGPARPTPAPSGGGPISETGEGGSRSPGTPGDATPEKGVIDPDLAAKAAAYVDAFTNPVAAFTRDGKRVVFISNRDGFPQLYIAGGPKEPATRLLETKERVVSILAAPGGKDILFRMDAGADENWSLYRVGLDGKNLIELTPGAKLNRDEPIIPDGKPSTMFFSARKMSEAKSTVYTASATAAGEAKAIYTDPKPAFLVDVAPDGKVALVQQYPTRSENYLLRLAVDSGKTEVLYPTEGKLSIFDAKFSRDGKRVYVATDAGSEQAVILALDTNSGKQLAKYALTPGTAQVAGLSVAKQGGVIAVSLIAGNRSFVRLLDAKTLAVKHEVQLPLGQGYAGDFSDDGKRLPVTWSTPSTPTDLFVVDAATGKVEPLRVEDRPTLKGMPAIEASIVDVAAFDGGKIPTNIYMPTGASKAKRPVLVVYHGGPAGTSVIRWNPQTAYFLSLGYIVVEPNVRGSGGFGRAFEEGDNGPRRLDAFKDIETSARWVAAQPWADKDRLVVFGGSYGGYTVLIALSRWPDIWRAGVNLFGVVNLKTFMATTSGLIRDIFLLEFGDPDKDAEFLQSISPIKDVDKIVDPTFVYAGANDPRVPRTESDLIVKALRAKKIPSEYMVSGNEGHSLSRRENQIEFLARVAKFLDAHLR